MSQRDAELVRRFIAAWNDGDLDAFERCAHPDVEFLLPRNLLEGGSYRGRSALRRAYADAAESWDQVRVEIDELRHAKDRVVVLARNINVGKRGGPRVEQSSALVIDLRDGLVARARPYQSHREALEAAGLSE